MRYSHKKLLLWFAVLLITTASSSCHSNEKAKQPKETQADRLNSLFSHSRTVLTSHEKDGEVHIPFTLRDGLICIQMAWAGKPVEAILDTGSYYVNWPQSLHLNSIKTGIPQAGSMAANVTTDGEWRVLPSIKAGGCEWQDMPTVAAGEMKLSNLPRIKSPSLKTIAPPKPILGAIAFHRVVLTIDYQKKEIIIRGSSYDITHLPHQPHDLLLTPEWINSYLPVLKGTLNNHPARFALDSACGHIVVNTRFVSRLPASSLVHATAELNGLQVSIQGLSHVSGTVAGVPFQQNGAQVIALPADIDALVGTDFLRQFRVTIDYVRGKILLEPCSGGQR